MTTQLTQDTDDLLGFSKEELLAIGKKKKPRKKAEPKPRAAKQPKEAKPVDFIPKGKFKAVERGGTLCIILPCFTDASGTQPLSGSSWGMLKGLFEDTSVSLDQCDLVFFYPQYVSNSLSEMNDAFRHPISVENAVELKLFLKQKRYKATLILGKHVMKKLIPGSEALDEERGAPYEAEWGLNISSYHPKDCFMDFALSLVLEVDIRKFVRLGTRGWTKKNVNVIHSPSFADCCAFLDRIAQETRLVTCDIETTYYTLLLTCIGFSINKQAAFVIPWMDNGKPCWSVEEECTLLRKLSYALNRLRLMGQNAVHFDHYALALRYRINANFVEDTMLAHWEAYPELPKSLGFINSFYTDNPYWKAMLKKSHSTQNPVMERMYNGLDNANTNEAYYEIVRELQGDAYTADKPIGESSLDHYRFNVQCARIFNYMSLHGAHFNTRLLDLKLFGLKAEAEKMQAELNAVAGKEIMVTSPQKMKAYLYDELQLPVRYKSVLNNEGDYEDKATQDYLTTLLLAREFPTLRQLDFIARLRKLKKRISSLSSIETRKNGVVGWGFNIVGTTTARLSSYKPADGAGVQAQNVDRNDRDLFSFNPTEALAPYFNEGKYVFPNNLEAYPPDFRMWLKADLEGADSWTVGAQLYALGDTTLIDDLRAGFKPAQILAIAMLHGTHLIGASHADLKPLKADLKSGKGKEMYAIAKAVNHGSAYMMAERTMNLNIFKQSKGEIYIAPEDCKAMQGLLFKRYNYPKLHGVMKKAMETRPYLDMPGGHRHYFLGRKDNSTLRQILASTPQYNTTVTANIVLHRLYYTPVNRKGTQGDLYLRPANQVHDETDCSFAVEDLAKVREVWNAVKDVNLTVMGVTFRIPFEAQFGPTWGNMIGEL